MPHRQPRQTTPARTQHAARTFPSAPPPARQPVVGGRPPSPAAAPSWWRQWSRRTRERGQTHHLPRTRPLHPHPRRTSLSHRGPAIGATTQPAPHLPGLPRRRVPGRHSAGEPGHQSQQQPRLPSPPRVAVELAHHLRQLPRRPCVQVVAWMATAGRRLPPCWQTASCSPRTSFAARQGRRPWQHPIRHRWPAPWAQPQPARGRPEATVKGRCRCQTDHRHPPSRKDAGRSQTARRCRRLLCQQLHLSHSQRRHQALLRQTRTCRSPGWLLTESSSCTMPWGSVQHEIRDSRGAGGTILLNPHTRVATLTHRRRLPQVPTAPARKPGAEASTDPPHVTFKHAATEEATDAAATIRDTAQCTSVHQACRGAACWVTGKTNYL